MNDIREEFQLTGFRKVTDTEDGGIRDIRPTWGGILAMLLRKIAIDKYDGKGIEGMPQFDDEKLTYPQFEEIIETTLQRYNGGKLSKQELNTERSRLLKEFSRDFLSIKFLGEFLNVLDLEWVDLTLVLQRRSGTTKSYTCHIGGIGQTTYDKPTYNEEYFKQSGTHEEVIQKPETEVLRVEKKSRGKKNG